MPRPTIINSTDAIVRMSRAAICGSDLHIYRGTQDGPPAPFGLGHEGVGFINEIGSSVGSLAVGDPVIVPFNTPEGHVHTSLTTSMYGGYGSGGDLGGTQAEYIRIPLANEDLHPVPSFTHTDTSTNATISLENDYVMLSDIFATGWAALDFSGFNAGDTIAIFGAGPVGPDGSPCRNAPWRFEGLQRGLRRRPSGDYYGAGAGGRHSVTRSIDAVGYEQINRNLTVQADVIIHNMLAATSAGGGIGTVGVYAPKAHSSATAPWANTVQDHVNFWMTDFFFGEFTWEAGPSTPSSWHRF